MSGNKLRKKTMKNNIECNIQKSKRMKYGVNMTNPLVSFLEGFNHCRENLNKSFQWRTKVRSIR